MEPNKCGVCGCDEFSETADGLKCDVCGSELFVDENIFEASENGLDENEKRERDC